MSTCIQQPRIDRHFEGGGSPADERAMRAHLPECSACAAHYRRWLLLARLDPESPSAEDRIARGLGFAPRPQAPRRPRLTILAGTATIVACAATLLLWAHARSGSSSFTARGGEAHSAVSRVLVYDVPPGAPPMLASGQVRRGDELAFAYENGAARKHLMIFGVDEHRHVYWFYPAWVSNDENPTAIAIEHDGLRHELPEAVRQSFDGAHLEIRSVFVDAPLDVRQVEALLVANPSGPLPIPGAIETPLSFDVAP